MKKMSDEECLQSAIIRFLNRFNKNSGIFGEDGKYPTECWIWIAGLDKDGYGYISVGNKRKEAHRFSYEYFVKKTELDLDHLCRQHNCIRPDHLEPCTRIENIMRGKSFSAINTKRTHCINGHPFSGDNLYYQGNTNKRGCKICQQERQRKRNGYLGNKPCKDRTHCPKGHEYNKENTYYEPKTNGRKCRKCMKEHMTKFLNKKK